MNYKKIYENLISKAKSRILDGEYTEKHHIIPLCIGGLDNSENLAVLTAREHYVAHKLLVKIYPNSKPLNLTLFMFFSTRKIKYSSRDYNKNKELFSQNMKINNPMFNKNIVAKKVKNTPNFIKFFQTPLGKEISSKRMRSENHPMKNKESVLKKIETQKKNGKPLSWTQTENGRRYFSDKFSSEEHPLRKNPENGRTAFCVEVTTIDGSILNFNMLKLFCEYFRINKDVAAKMVKTQKIPKKYLDKFIKVVRLEKNHG